jgi:hypothetical protein
MKNVCSCAVLTIGLAGVSAVGPIGLRTIVPGAAAQESKETPAEIIAAQIRMQGFTCPKARSAERDVERSQPHEAVWVLKCENATYRVRLIPDMAARVERLD